MCDLLGLSFSTPVAAKISLDVFQKRGQINPDGWGVAFYDDDRIQVIKEAKPAVGSRLFDFIEQYPQSRTIIIHVRKSTRGGRSYLNTHPFYRYNRSGSRKREYAFAHNGTLHNHEQLKLRQFHPIGETDSEHVFCYLLDALSTRQIGLWKIKDFQFIEELLQRINDEQNTLNCIFSDGEHLFCYSDENDHNNGLRYVKQTHPYGIVELVSSDEKLGHINIHSDSKKPSQTGYIISTRILTKERWTEFDGGELIVFRHGKVIYPNERVRAISHQDDKR
jgi:predicted glutamine amidotransferase